MPAAQNVFDALVKHRVDVLRFAAGESRKLERALAAMDVDVAEMLARRLPRLKRGDPRSPSLKQLAQDVADERIAALREIRDTLRADLAEFAGVELELVDAVMTRMVGGAIFDGVGADVIRKAIYQPFSAGVGRARTLTQWFDDIARADRQRILGALQHGIVAGADAAATYRAIVGTASAGYADGAMASARRLVETVTQTAINHITNSVMRLWAEANSSIVLALQWTGILDTRICELCLAQNGRAIPIGDRDPPRGMKKVTSPPPPIHPRDRCALVPILDKREVARRLARL